MDAVPAQLLITTGPDAGKTFGLREEIIHIGRAADNHIVLTDPTLPGRLASIASRGGRFAIYVPAGDHVEMDGNGVPSDSWTWLPLSATLRLSAHTTVRFETATLPQVNGQAPRAGAATVTVPQVSRNPAEARAAAEASSEEGSSAEIEGATRSKGQRKRKASSRKAQVARFITDQPGDPLVRLGEDGTLPELALRDSRGQGSGDERAAREKNPLLLYAVLGFSFVCSLGMLLLEPTGNTVSSGERGAAREALVQYFGSVEDGKGMRELELYEKTLRQALVEHSQGDYAEERRLYRRVLQMLNAADIRDPANLNGLTGRRTGRGRASDVELREHLETLIAP